MGKEKVLLDFLRYSSSPFLSTVTLITRGRAYAHPDRAVWPRQALSLLESNEETMEEEGDERRSVTVVLFSREQSTPDQRYRQPLSV